MTRFPQAVPKGRAGPLRRTGASTHCTGELYTTAAGAQKPTRSWCNLPRLVTPGLHGFQRSWDANGSSSTHVFFPIPRDSAEEDFHCSPLSLFTFFFFLSFPSYLLPDEISGPFGVILDCTLYQVDIRMHLEC